MYGVAGIACARGLRGGQHNGRVLKKSRWTDGLLYVAQDLTGPVHCQRVVAVQPDFASECSALQHAVETCRRIDAYTPAGEAAWVVSSVAALRHICLFLPKFHCELNWIEWLWGASKRYARSHCAYTLQGLRDTVPLSLSQDISDLPQHMKSYSSLPVAPLYLQRRWARISRQFMHEYRKGADACAAI